MRLGISKRGNEMKFELKPDNLTESAVAQNMFPYATPGVYGDIRVAVCGDNMERILKEFGRTLLANNDAKNVMSRISNQRKEYREQREKLIELYENLIHPYLENKVVPELPEGMRPMLPPMPHQQVVLKWMSEQLSFRSRFPLFLQQGMGKTFISLIWGEYLINKGYVKNILVVAPLFTLWNAWASDIEKFTSMDYICLRPSKSKFKEKLERLLNVDADVYLINHDAAHRNKELLMRKNFDMVIIDESTSIKNPKSKKLDSLRSISMMSLYRIILSGTPAPNGPEDLWSQWFWLDDGTVFDCSFSNFRSKYMHKVNDFIWKPIEKADEKLMEIMKPFSISFKRKFILDLPERQHILRFVRFTDNQMKVYKKLEKEQFAEYEGSTVSYGTLLPKFIKLRQVIGGFFFNDEDHKEVSLKENEKLGCLEELVSEILEDQDNSIIIWATFRYEIRSIMEMLDKLKIKYVCGYGEQSTDVTLENIEKFRTDNSIKVMVANPKSIGTGTNLQRSNFTIYYSLSENLQDFLQSLDRNYRTGQNRKVVVYYLIAKDTYDEKLISSLRRKEDFQSYITSGFRINDLRDPYLEEHWESFS